jgi:hypothetical protein
MTKEEFIEKWCNEPFRKNEMKENLNELLLDERIWLLEEINNMRKRFNKGEK